MLNHVSSCRNHTTASTCGQRSEQFQLSWSIDIVFSAIPASLVRKVIWHSGRRHGKTKAATVDEIFTSLVSTAASVERPVLLKRPYGPKKKEASNKLRKLRPASSAPAIQLDRFR